MIKAEGFRVFWRGFVPAYVLAVGMIVVVAIYFVADCVFYYFHFFAWQVCQVCPLHRHLVCGVGKAVSVHWHWCGFVKLLMGRKFGSHFWVPLVMLK